MEKIKVLFHIDELNKWNLTLANVENLLVDVGQDKVMVEIVANGPAIKIFDETSVMEPDSRQELHRQMKSLKHVAFVVCRNSLHANSINENLLPDFLTVVPAGITRILLQQKAGYLYVKP